MIYKTLSNPKRLEILNTIKNRELTAGELMEVLQVRKANLSQHLTILRNHRLVKTRRQGTNIYYSIMDPRIVEPCKILHEFWGGKSKS
ncbi:winged helix-turn-helix transcriptional regulator [Candidatus Kaiserbacteria bacterium]|nr:winged helix-turn-helix transcriptional regulator [Candidatus Kaiserbacteria bacterium]